ncbi:TolC family protein [Cardinium endosymbiont of Oedothorax gibbosus]|uniref:TolC family protein n=1 Tax=Cardinium endosymbiont of Oedothorax gibbosus TaxID=931101 RepID=UPI0020245984|nr:TolC family protein [Cardinium endosymbiont of Oedothorax gibbosus]
MQEAIDIALKDNFNIQIAGNTKKQAILCNRIDNFCMWTPRATFMLSHENIWRSGSKVYPQGNSSETGTIRWYIRSAPVFAFAWELSSLFDKIFQTKIRCQNNFVHKLVAKKSIEKELQQVVTAYYELALAQKKWELSNNLIKLATARLKVEEEKLRVGCISKIDCLDAQLALKQVRLSLLERREALTGKRRNLNLILGKLLHEETLVQSDISVQPIWDIKAVTTEKVVDLETAIQEKKVAIAATELSRAKSYLLSCLNLSGSFHSNSYFYDLADAAFYLDDKKPSRWLGRIGISMDIVTLLLMPAKIKKAKIALNNASFALQQQKLAVEGGLKDKKWNYRHALDAHKVVAEQLKISKQKLVFIREKYRLRQVKLLELHEAEEATQKAEIALVEHAFKVKQAEFDLYRLIVMFHQKLY